MRTRIRTPEPTLYETLSDQFSGRDKSLTSLYRHVTALLSFTQSQGQRISQLEARLRKLEPRPPAEKPAIERRPKRVAMTFQESDQ